MLARALSKHDRHVADPPQAKDRAREATLRVFLTIVLEGRHSFPQSGTQRTQRWYQWVGRRSG